MEGSGCKTFKHLLEELSLVLTFLDNITNTQLQFRTKIINKLTDVLLDAKRVVT